MSNWTTLRQPVPQNPTHRNAGYVGIWVRRISSFLAPANVQEAWFVSKYTFQGKLNVIYDLTLQGFIHLKCLNRWIRVRRTKLCEICKQEYNTPALERKYFALFLAFFRPKYLGVILKDIFNIMSVTPLVYFTVYQVSYCMIYLQLNLLTLRGSAACGDNGSYQRETVH